MQISHDTHRRGWFSFASLIFACWQCPEQLIRWTAWVDEKGAWLVGRVLDVAGPHSGLPFGQWHFRPSAGIRWHQWRPPQCMSTISCWQAHCRVLSGITTYSAHRSPTIARSDDMGRAQLSLAMHVTKTDHTNSQPHAQAQIWKHTENPNASSFRNK